MPLNPVIPATSVAQQLLAQASARGATTGGALRQLGQIADPGSVIPSANVLGNSGQAMGIASQVPQYGLPSVEAAGGGIVQQATAATAAPLMGAEAATGAGAGVIPAAEGAALGGAAGGKLAGLFANPMARAAGLAAAGYYGGKVLGPMNIGGEGSAFDRTASPALVGAGTGAAIGSIVPGVGTAIGAGVGALAGGLYGYFGGDKTTKAERLDSAYTGMKDTITQLGTTYGLSPSTMQNVLLEFDATAQIMKDQGDEKGFKAYVDNLGTTLPQTLLQYRLQDEADKKQNDRLMALQSQFAPMFQGIIDNSAINSNVAYTQALAASDKLAASNPQLAALISSNAASSRSNQDALMAAYASQIAGAGAQAATQTQDQTGLALASQLGLNAKQLSTYQNMNEQNILNQTLAQ